MSKVPGEPYTRRLFAKFMTKLTKRGLLKRVSFRNVKVVFFNLLAAIGTGTDEEWNDELVEKYLSHFKRTDPDNQRRFKLPDKDFKRVSELLDKLIFTYISDSYDAIDELPAPSFTTRKPPAWITSSRQKTTTSVSERPSTTTKRSTEFLPNYPQSFHWTRPPFTMPPLEAEYSSQSSSAVTTTTTYGGVASNTARPTTKSVLAELEFPSNHKREKFQFMHDPDRHKNTTPIPRRTTSRPRPRPRPTRPRTTTTTMTTTTTYPLMTSPLPSLSQTAHNSNNGNIPSKLQLLLSLFNEDEKPIQLQNDNSFRPAFPVGLDEKIASAFASTTSTTPQPPTRPTTSFTDLMQFGSSLLEASTPQHVQNPSALVQDQKPPEFTSTLLRRTTARPGRPRPTPPSFYPQLVQADASKSRPTTSVINNFSHLRPSFNNNITNNNPTMTTTKNPFQPLGLLDQHSNRFSTDVDLSQNHPHSHRGTIPPSAVIPDFDFRRPSVPTFRPTTASSSEILPIPTANGDNMTANQWNQIITKLNFALEKLAMLKNPDSASSQNAPPYPSRIGLAPIPERLGIIDYNQYVNEKGQKLGRNNVSDEVVINVYDYADADDKGNENGSKDYFDSVEDTDSIQLDRLKETPSATTQAPPRSKTVPPPLPTTTLRTAETGQEQDDYIDFYEDFILKLFDSDIPPSVAAAAGAVASGGSVGNGGDHLDLPGVGSKNPVPLSNFEPLNNAGPTALDAGRFPAAIPIPLTPFGHNGKSPFGSSDPVKVSINNDQAIANTVHGRTRLTPPGVISNTFGKKNDTQYVAIVPDITSSGPVDIPSPLQLYGNIGKYANNKTKASGGGGGASMMGDDFLSDVKPMGFRRPPGGIAIDPLKMVLKEQAATLSKPRPSPNPNSHKHNYDPLLLQAILDLLKERDQPVPPPSTIRGTTTTAKPNVHIDTYYHPGSNNRYGIQLPKNAVLPKPAGLAKLEAHGRHPIPVPIQWLDEKVPPRSRLPPFHRETLNANLGAPGTVFKRDQPKNPVDFWNSPSILNPTQSYPLDGDSRPVFKTPPRIFPIQKSPLDRLKDPDEPDFTILTPQVIPHRQIDTSPGRGSSGNRGSNGKLMDMLLRSQSIFAQSRPAARKSRMKRGNPELLLKKPAAISGEHSTTTTSTTGPPVLGIGQDIQLKPGDAILEILQQRPDTPITATTTTTTASSTKSSTSTTAKTILSKPVAIANEEQTLFQPQFFLPNKDEFVLQTSLLGVPNPATTSNSTSSSVTYNKLLIAAVLSIIPTAVIAYPFLTGRKRRRKK